ncbi:MAG: hypothetical protein GEV10_16600 [Streptosporangiales bacterium]|nr:hypothetical protein [Streptosporangiales bacterium]
MGRRGRRDHPDDGDRALGHRRGTGGLRCRSGRRRGSSRPVQRRRRDRDRRAGQRQLLRHRVEEGDQGRRRPQGQASRDLGTRRLNTALAHVALRKAGLAEKDVKFVTIGGSPERSAALLTGQVDATVIFFADWAAIADRSKDVKLLARMGDLVPAIPDLYYYGKSSYWKENPKVAEAVACANLQANAIIAKDKDAFVDFAAKSIKGSDKKVLASTYDELTKLGNWPTDPEKIMNEGGLDGLVELMIESETLDKKVDTKGLVDLSYLKKAADKGCGETA